MRKGGLLESILNKSNAEGVCATCGDCMKISDNAQGCVAKDKLIMPKYPPYHVNSNSKCKDWKKGET